MEKGCGIGVFCCGFWGGSLDRELLGFVRRGGSNDFWVSEWILLRVSRVELLYLYGETL